MEYTIKNDYLIATISDNGAELIKLIDKDNINKLGVKLITADLLMITDKKQVRHDNIKTALEVFTYLTRGV